MIIILNLHSGTKLSGWLRHWYPWALAGGRKRTYVLNSLLQSTEGRIVNSIPRRLRRETVRAWGRGWFLITFSKPPQRIAGSGFEIV